MDIDFNTIRKFLSTTEPNGIEEIKKLSYETMLKYVGDCVYLRGLIEFSNYCSNDCYYCGIRKSNKNLDRYYMTREEIISTVKIAMNFGYGSIVLQSGEIDTEKNINFIAELVSEIKEISKSDTLPEGLGITLSIGELSYQSYEKLFKAGAHRYLLRIETSNRRLFEKLHPAQQLFDRRLECLNYLRNIGYQVGTGVMIGLPDQTIDDLANDVLFFKEQDIDMIGMGPFIPHKETVYANIYADKTSALMENYRMTLKMIAAVRIALKDVNIASATALQAINPWGREEGLQFGANVMMPNITPLEYREKYQLYDNKPCTNISPEEYNINLQKRIQSIGRRICYNEWGDSKHYWKRSAKSERR